MKKSLSALIVALLIFTGPLMSQKQLYFGLAGTGLSSVITNQNNYGQYFEMDYKVTFGGSGNVNIGFDFNKHIGLKLELGFAKLGQKYEDTHGDTLYTRNVKLNYLQIPLMFKYRTGGTAQFYVMAGIQLDMLLSAKQKYIQSDSMYFKTLADLKNNPYNVGEETITTRYSSMDVMGRLDLGVDIHVASNIFLNVGLTMAYGLTDINAEDFRIKDHTGNYNPSHNIYGGLNVGINYVLPVGSK
ncbi:MAG: porin family protein [Bacteroidales bacterium]